MLAMGTRFQVAPFQCRIMPAPTAHASLADMAATEYKTAPGSLLGLGTCFHAVPFQCRISVLRSLIWPRAQASVLDVAATPKRLIALV